MSKELLKSYEILDSLRLKNNLYLASSSSDYNFVWLRDSFYEVLPYLDKDCDRYERTYWAILDILKSYSWKIKIHRNQKPTHTFEYIHPRYTFEGKEVDKEWGNCQHDAVGCILYGIAKGEENGKVIIRDNEDIGIIQDIIQYLGTCEYYNDPDNGMWEEGRELHSSSIGAVVAGLNAINDYIPVPKELINKGLNALGKLLPHESPTKECDLSQLSLIYPYNILDKGTTEYIVDIIEDRLLRNCGVIRYKGDSYYSAMFHEDRSKPLDYYFGKEAEWTFGLPWLALAHMSLGNYDKAEKYIKHTEKVMTKEGFLPELYFAQTKHYNGNTPLGWSSAMYILAKEKFLNNI